MKKVILIGLTACLITGCTGKKEVNGDDGTSYKVVTGYDQDERENGEGLNASVVRTVRLETTDANLLESLNKVVIASDSIIVLSDGNVVQSYGMDGHFRCQYGSKGEAGNEYITLSGFYVNDNDEVVVVDSYRNCLLRYNLDGSFVGKINAESPTLSLFYNALPVDGSSILMANYISHKDNPLYVNYNINDSTATPIFSSSLRTNGAREYIGHNPMSRCEDQLHLLMPFSQYIYDQNGNEAYKIETEKHVLDSEELAAITNYDVFAVYDQYMKGNFCGFSDIFETSSHIVCCFISLSYTVIDKSTLKCNTYKYTSSNNMPGENITPLVNLVGSHGDCLIGYLFDTFTVKSELIETLMERWNCEVGEDDNPVIVFYQIK